MGTALKRQYILPVKRYHRRAYHVISVPRHVKPYMAYGYTTYNLRKMYIRVIFHITFHVPRLNPPPLPPPPLRTMGGRRVIFERIIL